MRRLEALTAVAAVVTVLVALTDSPGAAAIAGALLLALVASALAAARFAAARRRRVGALGRQFTVAVAVAVGQIVLAMVLFAVVMFISAHDALLASLVAVFSGLLAIVVARMLAGGVMGDIVMLRDALAAVGSGRRDLRIAVAGADELAELGRAANMMIERLGAEEEARRRLVAAISHDLRTPITSLRLLADALGDEIVAPEERHAYLERMGTHLRGLNALIDDLFELARLEAGEVAWSPEPVQVEPLVAEAVDALRPEAERRGVRLDHTVADTLPPVRASPEKLQRVLFNLLDNGIRHTPPDGTVSVHGATANGDVRLEVADTGTGIAGTERSRVFEAFHRGGDEAARGGGGAGLGLAIARALVEAHGGRIWLGDAQEGTRVCFTIPRAQAPVHQTVSNTSS